MKYGKAEAKQRKTCPKSSENSVKPVRKAVKTAVKTGVTAWCGRGGDGVVR